MSSNETLPYGTFLSYIFRTLRINLDDEGNWVCKFDRQSSAAQALTVPPVALQSSDAPRPPHEAYRTLIAPLSLRTVCLLEAINRLSLQVDA
ncbi:hypothetical protein Golax_024259 [Gossypium laxum]|uniref:Uncharacterized protein n=1 Tax=Gossypium laxum TaxID=34288 RepID=A0A7J8ZBI9_9ROSI|nr:hypothetical protein [Gossypium laxum]